MKKVLVIGSEGFLGRRVAEYFSDSYEVIGKNHSEIDITSFENVDMTFQKYRPDYVINCAAISSVDDCEKDKEKSRKINLDGCVYIAKAAVKTDTKCIFCSSDQVYFGNYKESSRSEGEELHPFNEYGRQKLETEKIVLAFNKNAVFLRLSWMYDLERKCEKEHSSFIQNLIIMIENQDKIGLAVHDIRGITDVNEVVQNLEKAFELEGGIYNFGSPVETNMYETVQEAFKQLGWNTDCLEKNMTAFKDKPRNMAMDQTKINKCGIYFQDTIEALVKTLKRYDSKQERKGC